MVTFLIVDDDQFIHKVLERILSLGGHQVLGHAYNGAEAVEKYVQLNPKPDIVLMDHRMPVMNGATATRELMHIDADCRILFLSADETVKDEAIEAGAIGFLPKPIRANTLFSAVSEMIAQ
jgi:two-component system chemotaxis response regulator CheY